MSYSLPKPKYIDESEVVVSRDDWDRLVQALSNLESQDDTDEDADDLAAIARLRTEDAALAARLERERGEPVEVTIPIEVIDAVFNGAHPVKAWRDHRGWTQLSLSNESGVRRDLIAKIETRQRHGTARTLDRLARALQVPIEALLEDAC